MNTNILIVDDDQSLRKSLVRILTDAGYTSVEAGNSEEAQQITGSQEFGLMIVDLNLPGLNGLDLIDRLRHHGKTCPAIILTSDASTINVNEAIELGVHEFFSKGEFNADSLLETIKKYV